MTAVEGRLKTGISHIKAGSKDQVSRRIVFVPPRAVSKSDADGFSCPDNYFTDPAVVQAMIGWKSVGLRGLGLRNCGNTCYMNSVLQALTHSSALANDAVSEHHISQCPRRKSNIFCGYCALLTHVKAALSSQGKSELAPDAILRHLKLISKNMRFGRQEDSHEFLRQLIDSCVNGELPLKLTSNPKGPIVPPLARSTTVVGQLFSGYLQSQITCSSCGSVSRTFDPYMDISLEIQESQSVVDCLRRFTHADTLQGQNAYKCSKCQKRVTAKKQMLVHRCPPLLTIQLKRFNVFASRQSPQKISKAIHFGEKLDMSPFMSTKSNASLNYSLYAVIVHEGSSMGSGHYVCYAKAANGMWYLFNDSQVRQVSEKIVFSQSAYILMYESKDSRCLYPSFRSVYPDVPDITVAEDEDEVTPVKTAVPAVVTVNTPTCPDIPTVTVINHDEEETSDDESASQSSDDEVDDNEVPSSKIVGRRPLSATAAMAHGPMRFAIPRRKERKVLRMLTVMRLISRKQKHAMRKRELGIASVVQEHTPVPPATTPVSTHTWGKIPVAAWDETRPAVNDPKFRLAVTKMTRAVEPGARSQHDLEYDLGKSMHNPRSAFASGNGLPPTLKDSFNSIAKGEVFRRQPSKGGKGKGGKGFGKGKGKGSGGFGKGKGKGGFGKGKGKGQGGRSFSKQ